ncbi:MAG: type II toxin-antitoxin system RelE/ParE family toxin [Bacteroidetes bacterium]|nr:type II toxin-antitoxin system RelE/ParE family toxin [Bacteroidota bacterium]
MKIEFKKPFFKELKKIRSKSLKDNIASCIVQVESAENITQIKNLKKLVGYDAYYRIRIGDYRIGVKIEKDIVYFVIFGHRKEIYETFP